MLADLFAGTRETLILIPKKNGKSTLLGAIALFHLCTTPDAECVIAAASRDQAQIMLRQAQGFIRRSAGLQSRLEVNKREIVHQSLGGRVRVLASDVDTADGVIPTLALVDELHRHKSADLYGVFRDGLGPRDGRMVTISTAGDDDESPLGQLRAGAYAMPGLVRDGAYRYARSGGFVMHEWALEPTDDRNDLELVKQANPAPWQTVEQLGQRLRSPSMTASQWARFACGVWMRGDESAISAVEWWACSEERIPVGEPVWLGADFGWKWDTTALVPFWMPESQRRVIGDDFAEILTPPQDGSSMRPEVVQEAFRRIHERNPVHTVVMDESAGGAQMADWIESELQAKVVSHSQGHSAMALAYERWMEALREGWLHHSGEPEFARHVLNAVARVLPGGQARFDRPSRSRGGQQDRRVWDALTAASMVHSVAVGEDGGSAMPMAAWA